jgi:dCTP deaminase
MILSNVKILEAIKEERLAISSFTGNEDPSQKPFNTSAVDLRLGDEISVPEGGAFAVDLRKPDIIKLLAKHCETKKISASTPYALEKGVFVLARTLEMVSFPIRLDPPHYSARIEGKSSLARCGILVHFTAPTIHAGFRGTITLEITNLGTSTFLLFPEMYICQLIIEEVRGALVDAPNQFMDQCTPVGSKGVPPTAKN